MSSQDEVFAATIAGTDPALVTSELTGESRQLLAGRWEILGLLGAGGMGSVYRAHDRELDEMVALKMVHKGAIDGDLEERFRREVKLSRRVTHRNVARVFEFAEHGGERFFTMELVDGPSLRVLLSRNGAFSPTRVVEIALAVCQGLAAAHEVGVIHRDLKPDNVLVAKDGRIAITDFGIAASLETSGHSGTTSFVGTPQYMAPEQVDRSRPIDARSDIYALGAMLYELATGMLPWQGETPLAVAAARLLHPPPDPRQTGPISDAMALMIMRCMARNPEDRFASVAELERALLSSSLSPTSLSPTSLSPTSLSPTSLRTPGHTRVVEVSPWSLVRPGDRVVRLAVMPLFNSGPVEDAFFAEGLTDDLVDALTSARSLRLTAPALTARYTGQRHVDVAAVGEELGVEVVAEGTLRRLPDRRLRLALRLITVAEGLQIWAQRFDVSEAELMCVNDRAADAIASALTIDAPAAPDRGLSDPVAVELYLRARAKYRDFSPESFQESASLYEQALARVPDDPVLLAGHATVLARLNFFVGNMTERAEAAARRALSLAPNAPEGHLALAAVELQKGNYAESLSAVLSALRHGPTLAEAHQLLGRILSEVGPLEMALRSLDLAAELDPTGAFTHRERARVLALMGRWEESAHALLDAKSRAGPLEHLSNLLMAARLSGWQRDRAAVVLTRRALLDAAEAVRPSMPARADAAVKLAQMMQWDAEHPVYPQNIDQTFGTQNNALRRGIYFLQLSAEIACNAKRFEAAVSWIEEAVVAGLVDVVWLDNCVLLEQLRTLSSWEPLRSLVEARASQVRALLPAQLSASAAASA